MKTKMKKLSIRIFKKLLNQPLIQKSVVASHANYSQTIPAFENKSNPYQEYAKNPFEDGEGVIFISGRFRSGSTLLWNVFRQSSEFTSFYEPFNERKWFNPDTRGSQVDETHRGVKDYWLEYEGYEELAEIYDEDWIKHQLLMNKNAYQPQMRSYIDTLIKKSPARPVLQFNRIDFRLPWLKQHYPKARFIHLYRNPRDQWCSFLTDKQLMNKDDVGSTYVDSFYLNAWCSDLSKHFPFLDATVTPHPYNRFYLLWKLSYLFGTNHADISVSYEDLVTNTVKTSELIKDVIGADKTFTQIAESLINTTSLGTWVSYADEDWFFEKEAECEAMLDQFLCNAF